MIGKLVNATIGPVEERIERAARQLLFMEVGRLAVGGPPPTLTLDTHAIRGHGDTVRGEADTSLAHGRTFANKVGMLTFTTGG